MDPRPYQFLFLRAADATPDHDFFVGTSDGDALAEAARQMAGRAGCRGVEVFDGDRLVCRLEKLASESDRPAIHGAGPQILLQDGIA